MRTQVRLDQNHVLKDYLLLRVERKAEYKEEELALEAVEC